MLLSWTILLFLAWCSGSEPCPEISNPFYEMSTEYEGFEWGKENGAEWFLWCPYNDPDFFYIYFCNYTEEESDEYYDCIDKYEYEFIEWCEEYRNQKSSKDSCEYAKRKKESDYQARYW